MSVLLSMGKKLVGSEREGSRFLEPSYSHWLRFWRGRRGVPQYPTLSPDYVESGFSLVLCELH